MLHEWRIEEREYARQEARRGRRHAYGTLDPPRTALVVVDMVPFFVEENPYCRGIVPNVNRLAASLRAAGGVVAWVLPAGGPPTAHAVEFYGPAVAEVFAASGAGGLSPELGAAPDDLVVEKTGASAFFPGSCDLPARLADRSVDTVLIAGTVTNVCCESSARDASTLGLRVVFLADATAAVRDRDHNATLHTVYRTFGDVRPCAEVVAMLAAAVRSRRG